MRSVGLVGLALLVGGCFFISPVYTFGGGKSQQAAEKDLLTKATPPALATDHEWSGDVTVAKIRVYADQEYRVQNLQWRQTFDDALNYANQVLAAQFGVKLEADYRVWNRNAGSAPLAQSLDALVKEDPGNDVLAVIGLTSSLSMVSASIEELGIASEPGRHLVLRGHADIHERRIFDQVFDKLGANERDALYQARRRHKTTTVLLHELGHNFGASHREIADSIMNPMYSDHATAFDPTSHAAIRAGLDDRLHRTSPARRTAVTTNPATPAVQQDSLVIQVDGAGQWIVGGNAIDQPTLQGLLQLTFRDEPNTAIIIKAAPGSAPNAAAQGAAALAKTAGLKQVTITNGP